MNMLKSILSYKNKTSKHALIKAKAVLSAITGFFFALIIYFFVAVFGNTRCFLDFSFCRIIILYFAVIIPFDLWKNNGQEVCGI